MAVVIGGVLKRLVAGDTLCRVDTWGRSLPSRQSTPCPFWAMRLKNAARRGLLGSNMRHFELDFDIGTGSLLELISRHLSARGGGIHERHGRHSRIPALGHSGDYMPGAVLFYVFGWRVPLRHARGRVCAAERGCYLRDPHRRCERNRLFCASYSVLSPPPARSIRRATSRACCWCRHCC